MNCNVNSVGTETPPVGGVEPACEVPPFPACEVWPFFILKTCFSFSRMSFSLETMAWPVPPRFRQGQSRQGRFELVR